MSVENQGDIDVLVYGLGAIGSFYSFVLSRSEQVRLSVIARSNYDAVRQNGMIIKSEAHGDHVVHPHRVLRNAAEAEVSFDYIICAHKAIDPGSAPAQIAPAVNKNTTLVIIQNGVGNEEPFREAFTEVTIISGVTWTGAIQTEPGIFAQRRNENIQIGLYENSGADKYAEKKSLERFVSLLAAGNTPHEVVSNIQVQRWEKVVWNAAWNSLTTLTLLDVQSWLSSSGDATCMTKRLMNEVIDVANGCKVPLEYDLADRLIEKVLRMPPVNSSMQTDYKAGRPMEVDIILGAPYKKGKALGLETPTLDAIYLVLTAVNGRLIQASQ